MLWWEQRSQVSKAYRKAAKSIIKKAWREEKAWDSITLKLAGRLGCKP